MVVCPDASAVFSCGPTLRRVDLKNNAVMYSKQIGNSQIFQIVENNQYIMVINFEGLVSLLNKWDLKLFKQFYAGGKEIRHSSIDEKIIALSC